MKSLNQNQPQSIADLARTINIDISGRSQFRKFQRTYRDDRIAFVFDCMPKYKDSITAYQIEILGDYDDGHERVAVRGPHGLGKTFIAAALTHHTVLTSEEDAKVPTTASAWRQLEKYLWPEIKKLAKALDWDTIGREPYNLNTELMNLSIRLNDGLVEAFAVASDDHNTIEGAHATNLFYIFDEAKTIPRPTWDAAEGAFSSSGLGGKIVEEAGRVQILETKPGMLVWENDDSNLEPEELLEAKGESIRRRLGIMPAVYTLPSLIVPGNGGNGHHSNTIGAEEGQLPQHTPTPYTGNQSHNPTSHDLASSHYESKRQIKLTHIHSSMDTIVARALAISTPGEPNGQFYDIHMKKPGYEDWIVRHVTLDEAIAAGRISRKWADQRGKQWGLDSAIYQNRVLGEFAETSEEGVIPLSWIRAAMYRWQAWYDSGKPDNISQLDGVRSLGCDIARAGVDKTVLAERYALVIKQVYTFSKLSTTSTAGRITRIHKGKQIHIEIDGGLGAAVYDMLRDDGIPMLHPISVTAGTTWRDKSGELGFLNVRAAMYWNMREMLDPDFGSEVMLPPLPELEIDLSAPRYEIKRGAIVQLEAKESIISRIGRSTDYGDAVCLAFWGQSYGGGVVF